uniref:hypothetical protein n=1 Tax=Streptomyces sp. rh185 TaxID=3028729 RepID=UPI003C7AFF38
MPATALATRGRRLIASPVLIRRVVPVRGADLDARGAGAARLRPVACGSRYVDEPPPAGAPGAGAGVRAAGAAAVSYT